MPVQAPSDATLKLRTDAVSVLVSAGFDPQASLAVCGLPPIAYEKQAPPPPPIMAPPFAAPETPEGETQAPGDVSAIPSEEAARLRRTINEAAWSVSDRYEPLSAAIHEQCGTPYSWIVDLFDDAVVYEVEGEGGYRTYRAPYSIDDAGVVALGTPAEVMRRTEYVDVPGSAEAVATEAAVFGEVITIREGAVRPDGTTLLKLIAPGQGSSGQYPAEVLRRDGPTAFPKGTKNYWDHPTATEESDRPERSLRDVAGVLLSDARYEESGPEGPGLYAEAQVFDAYRESVNEMAPYIGMSIRASALAPRTSNPVIEKLLPDAHNSVDFVTVPGAGGRIVSLFEAARGGRKGTRVEEESMQTKGTGSEGAPEGTVTEASNPDVIRLNETVALQAQEIAKLRERAIRGDAVTLAASVLGEIDMPTATRKRLAESLPLTAPVKDGELDREGFTAAVREAASQELAYLAEAGIHSGGVRGLGITSGGTNVEEAQAKLGEHIGEVFGLSETGRQVAVNGRG